MDRVRVATSWLGGCSGCHMSFLDLDECLIELANRIELVYSPLMDTKQYPENVHLCLVEGAICNQENLEAIHTIRARTKVLVAFGDCAVTANVPAIRNHLGARSGEIVVQHAYGEGIHPGASSCAEARIIPALLGRVMPLHEAVYVDYFVPGCPPPVGRIKMLLDRVLNGALAPLEGQDLKFG